MTRPGRHSVCCKCGLTPFVCVVQDFTYITTETAHFPYCPMCYYFTAMRPPSPFMTFEETLTLHLWLNNF